MTPLDPPDPAAAEQAARGSTEPPVPPAAASPPAEAPAPAQRPPGALVAGQLLRVEIAMLARVLATVLGAALPPSMIEVEHVRSMGDMLRGRPGQAIGVRIIAGQQVLGFRAPEVGVTEAYVSHVVRGIVLSTEPVPVADWLHRLGATLDAHAAADAASSAALQRFIDDRT